MSVTTTENRTFYDIAQTLREYDVHHSPDQPAEEFNDETNRRNDDIRTTAQNPTNWPTHYRRIPAYRPINTNLDLSIRGTRNNAEAVFVTTMLSGVYIIASVAQIWHRTGGRISNNIFRYKIGGEW